MIQFRLDKQYISDIDALLKKQIAAQKERTAAKNAEKPTGTATETATEKQPIRLLPPEEIPFSLEKRHSKNPKASSHIPEKNSSGHS